MRSRLLTFRSSLLFAIITLLASAELASASSIALTDVQLQFDLAWSSVSLSSGLEAHGDPAGTTVFLDGITVTLSQDGNLVDLVGGMPTL